MSKHLPIIVLLICTGIALLLVFSFQPWWPAALAVAIAGAALALGLREQNGAVDGVAHEYEMEALREANASLRADLDEARAAIGDLADVVEQIASAPAQGYAGDEIDGPADSDLTARLAEVEAKLAALRTEHTEPGPAAPPEPHASQGASAGEVQSLLARVSRKTKPDAGENLKPSADTVVPVRLSPVFAPALGAPVSFIVSAEGGDGPENLTGLFGQAARVANQLEGAGRDVGLFVRLSAANLADESVRGEVLGLIDSDHALRRRMTLMTPQTGFDDTAQAALAAFVERGCRFALSDVRDWSLNLAALSRAGLTYIAVDGPAMARSAREQGGDPRRLAEALAAHRIALIGAGIDDRAQIEDVRTLNPDLMAGEGIGASRVVEVPA